MIMTMIMHYADILYRSVDYSTDSRRTGLTECSKTFSKLNFLVKLLPVMFYCDDVNCKALSRKL